MLLITFVLWELRTRVNAQRTTCSYVSLQERTPD